MCRKIWTVLVFLLAAAVAFGQQPEKIQLKITKIKAYRTNPDSMGRVLGDIDSRMPANSTNGAFGASTYRCDDRGTWAHEATHGVNALIRNHYGRGTGADNGFYLLWGNAAVVAEPPTTLSQVARFVPQQLRGKIYQLYLQQQLKDWNNQPLYIVDEWTSYINGATANLEYSQRGMGVGGGNHDVRFTAESGVYSLTLAMIVAIHKQQQKSRYDDAQFRALMMYNCERMMKLFNEAKQHRGITGGDPYGYWQTFTTGGANDIATLRGWLRWYFGPEWTKAQLGF